MPARNGGSERRADDLSRVSAPDFAGPLRRRYPYLAAAQPGILFDMWIEAVALIIVIVILGILVAVASFWLFVRFSIFCVHMYFRIENRLMARAEWRRWSERR